jgi:hypothetical protein
MKIKTEKAEGTIKLTWLGKEPRKVNFEYPGIKVDLRLEHGAEVTFPKEHEMLIRRKFSDPLMNNLCKIEDVK